MPLDVGLESSGLVHGRKTQESKFLNRVFKRLLTSCMASSLPRPQHTVLAFQLAWLAVFLELLYTILILVPGSPTPLTEVTSLNKNDLEPLFLRPWVCALICKPGSLSRWSPLRLYPVYEYIYIHIHLYAALITRLSDPREYGPQHSTCHLQWLDEIYMTCSPNSYAET